MDFPAAPEFASADRVVAAPSFPAALDAYVRYATVSGDRRTRTYRQAIAEASVPAKRLFTAVAAESGAGLWVTQNTVMHAAAEKRNQ